MGIVKNLLKRILLQDHLQAVHLIFCRDCLVHFSSRDVLSALKTVCESGSTYLLTTRFPDWRRNSDIATGQWRALNLQIDPFRLPSMLKLLSEAACRIAGASQTSRRLWRRALLLPRLGE